MKTKTLSKVNIQKIFLFLLFAFAFSIPTLTHNYLLYKDKGFMDLIFTRFTGIGENVSAQYYSWDATFTESNSWKGLIFGNKKYIASGTPLLLGAINYIRIYSPVNFYLGIIGVLIIFFLRKENYSYLVFFILSIAFILPFLASSILLPKHYLFLDILFIPLAALTIYEANKTISNKLTKSSMHYIIILLLIFSFFFLGLSTNSAHFYSKSNIAQMIDFKKSNIPQDALMVIDSRMYRGRINLVSQERPYLEGSDFLNLINNQDQITGNIIPVEVYYLECVPEDCGWGTIKDQPEFNSSMESLTDFFKQNGNLVKTIHEPNMDIAYFPFISDENLREYIRIYYVKLSIKDSILKIADQPKNWFLYDIGYQPKEKQFDYYETHNIFDAFLNKLAHSIVLLALILAFISPLYVLYMLKNNSIHGLNENTAASITQ